MQKGRHCGIYSHWGDIGAVLAVDSAGGGLSGTKDKRQGEENRFGTTDRR